MNKKHKQCVPAENFSRALTKLKESGLKMTPTRKHVLNYLTAAHGPFAMEDIHAGVKKKKDCNLTTVYRIVSQFEKMGLVRRSELGDGMARFEYQCDEHPHHHLICKNCKKIVVLEKGLLPGIEKIAKKQGFSNVNPYFEIFGLCSRCDT